MPLTLDTTASLASNRVQNEHITITASGIASTGVIFLKQAPFFAKDLNIVFVDNQGAQQTLVKDTDYWLVGQWRDIGLQYGGVYAAIFVSNAALAGNWYVTYRALGGNASISQSQILQYYSTSANRAKATSTQIQPQASLNLTVTTMKDLQIAQTKYAVIPMTIGYYLAPAGTTTPSTTPQTPVIDTTQAINTANQALSVAQAAEVTANNAQTAVAGKYTFPIGGIGNADLSSDVRASLAKAATALQAIPVATTTVAGGVKQGPGNAIAPDGTLTVPSASVSAVGLIQLAGDLSGTASAPIVVGLSNKQDRLIAGTTIKTIGGVSPLGSGDIPFPVVTPSSIGAVSATLVGAVNGVSSLDATGKVPLSQIPTAILGAMSYQGAWNAALNIPALASGAGTKGNYYSVSVSGTTTIDTISQWNKGDHIAFNGAVWEKFDGTAAAVSSVAGKTGAVALTSADLTDGSTLGRQLFTASSQASAQTLLGVSAGGGGAGVSVTISGTRTVGSVLTASLPAGWSAASWVWTRTSAAGVSYVISGETSAAYTVKDFDQGFTLTPTAVNLSYVGQTGASVSATAGTSAAAISTKPVITAAASGSALTFSAATVTGTPTPAVSYSILASGNVVANNVTSGSYVVQPTDRSLSVRVSAYNAYGAATQDSDVFSVATSIPGSISIDGGATVLATGDGILVFTDPVAGSTLLLDGQTIMLDGQSLVIV